VALEVVATLLGSSSLQNAASAHLGSTKQLYEFRGKMLQALKKRPNPPMEHRRTTAKCSVVWGLLIL
jgi:hypothetical protein